MGMTEDNVIYQKSFNFAVRTVNLYKHLSIDKKEYVLSKQLLRSGTSIGANITESLKAQSRKDFIAKMHIAYKEAGETEYWLKLLIATDYLEEAKVKSLIDELIQIIKLLTTIINSSKNNY